MKKLLFTITLSLVSGILFAHHNSYGVSNNSDLNIKMWDNSSFIITLDNERSERTRNYSLKNITPGNHYIKVVKKEHNHYGNGGFVQTVYKGRINVPARRNVFVNVEGKNRLSFKFLKKRKNRQHGLGNQHINHHGNQHNLNSHFNDWYGECTSNNSYEGDAYGNYGNNNYYFEPMAMNNNSFNQLIDVIKNESFDKDRLLLATQAIFNNSISAKQVAFIMEEFAFENNKLKFAKKAYHKTIDKENYFIVNNAFSFTSSISKLNNYIIQI